MHLKGLRRFFVEEILKSDKICAIKGSEAKHITKVLKMGRGERLIIMDGKGTRFLASIESASPKEVRVLLETPLPSPTPSPIRIILCQSLLKSRNMDLLIQKTSELGVDSVLPFSSERTVVRLTANSVAHKQRHWLQIAQSSAKQADRATPAEIGPPNSFEGLIADWKGQDALKAILWEAEETQYLKDLLKMSSQASTFVGIVGPEGGFLQEEIDMAKGAGFMPVSLGNRVLRSETAAITLVALVQYELGDLGL
jgi:16S rRNA (uracil1498-N3)-methyltransferase